ncbi:MAG: phosphoribosylglycinamide formyltransferase [Microscillaceae bacterium]|nr:phosphoribosylglycinamide formyltransferase [Microscillaceae bacterium]
MQTHKIALFASGSGSNVQKIAEYFRDNPQIEIVCILSNNPQAGVLQRAADLGILSYVFNRQTFFETREILDLLLEKQVNLVVLAGFLWKIPDYLIHAFPHKIINIHPALLPKYGGKGMYGIHVHQAVFQAGDRESGITIHYVNDHYDEGEIIFQAHCELSPEDDPEKIAQKVQALEHKYFPKVIEELLNKSSKIA